MPIHTRAVPGAVLGCFKVTNILLGVKTNVLSFDGVTDTNKSCCSGAARAPAVPAGCFIAVLGILRAPMDKPSPAVAEPQCHRLSSQIPPGKA